MFEWWRAGNSKTFNQMTPEDQQFMRTGGIKVLDLKSLQDDWYRKETKGFFPE
jgi:hypothetical protein